MSVPNAIIPTMTELKQMCEQMADYFLWVFEGYWTETNDDPHPDDVNLALYAENLTFQIAFAINYGMIKPDSLTETGLRDLVGCYQEMASSGAWDRFLASL